MFFEYEQYIDIINEIQKKEEEQRKRDEKNNSYKMPNPNNYKLPKVSVPKF
jgi:hypothetical protein